MDIRLLHILLQARHPSFDIDVRHLFTGDRRFLQENIARVPNDTPENVSKEKRAMDLHRRGKFDYGRALRGVMSKQGPGLP